MLLYFIPEAKALTPQVIADHCLAHLAGHTSQRETFRGPRGAGLLVSANTTPADLLAYDENKQTWSERFGLESLVGTWHDHPVRPESLLRDNPVAGQSIELIDGNKWIIPLLRQWRAGDDGMIVKCKLPCVMQQSPIDGRFVLGKVIPTYRQIWEQSLAIAEQILRQLSTDAKAEMEDADVDQFVIDLLAVNYRVDASIVSHLQLLTPELCGQIICAALDLDTLRHSLKNLYSRRLSGGMNTESGATLPTED